MLTFREYQSKTAKTAVYREEIDKIVADGDTNMWKLLNLLYVSLGLGEVGELQGKIKKIIRDNGGIVNDDMRKDIAKELGDILWYISQTCTELGLAMGDVAELNLIKLASRKERGVLKGSGDER